MAIREAVLARFSEIPCSGIGLGYVLSVADGALWFSTQSGPIQETAALADGAFLVGYQGYGVFETLRYERDGRMLTRWASHGHYIVAGNDIRVIEMGNYHPSKSHLARLLPRGAVARGARLDGYHTSQPCLRTDETALFFRSGALLAARELAIEERLELCTQDSSVSTSIAAGDESAYFAFWRAADTASSPLLVRVAAATRARASGCANAPPWLLPAASRDLPPHRSSER